MSHTVVQTQQQQGNAGRQCKAGNAGNAGNARQRTAHNREEKKKLLTRPETRLRAQAWPSCSAVLSAWIWYHHPVSAETTSFPVMPITHTPHIQYLAGDARRLADHPVCGPAGSCGLWGRPILGLKWSVLGRQRFHLGHELQTALVWHTDLYSSTRYSHTLGLSYRQHFCGSRHTANSTGYTQTLGLSYGTPPTVLGIRTL